MNTYYYFKKINKTNGEKLKDYFEKEKTPRLTKLLQHGNFELAEFKLRAEYFLHHNAFQVEVELNIGKHKLVSQEKSHNLLKALDLAIDRQIAQLRKLESIKHNK